MSLFACPKTVVSEPEVEKTKDVILVNGQSNASSFFYGQVQLCLDATGNNYDTALYNFNSSSIKSWIDAQGNKQSNWDTMYSNLTTVLDQCIADGEVLTEVGLIYWQGEGDWSPTNSVAFEACFQQFIDCFKADIASDYGLDVVIAAALPWANPDHASYSAAHGTGLDTIRAAITNVISNCPRAGVFETADLARLDLWHLAGNSPEQKEAAQRAVNLLTTL